MPAMRSPRTKFAVVALATWLGGCVGWPSSVDESGLPDTQVGGYCTGSVTDTADIEGPAGLAIGVRPAKDKLNLTILLDVSIIVPYGVYARLLPAEVTLHSPEWPEPKRLAVDHFSDRGETAYPATTTLKGDARDLPAVFSLWYFPTRETELPQTGILQVREFTLELSVIEVNGQDFQAEPITFRSYRKLTLSRCLQ